MSTQKRSKIEAINPSEPSRRSRYIGDNVPPMPFDPIEIPIAKDQTPQVDSTTPIFHAFNEENPAIAPLTNFLGTLLTVANPVWMSDPVPGMRMLQKKLIAHALTLDEKDRSECMDAIAVVDNAVQLRLRWQQMRMTEEELNVKPETVKKP